MKKRKLFFLFILLVILVVVLIYLFVINKSIQEKQLLIDVKSYADSNLIDVKKSRANVFGKYRKIEDAVYQYILDFQKQYSKVLDYASDEELTSILSVDNYSSDGPLFVQSNQYIEKVRSEFDQDMQKLISFSTEDGLEEYVKKLNFSSYEEKVFLDSVNKSGLFSNFNSYQDEFLESENHMNSIFNSIVSTLGFLKTNSDNWKIEEGEIQFSTEDLVNQYNQLVSNLL